jgi:hypothetical protein
MSFSGHEEPRWNRSVSVQAPPHPMGKFVPCVDGSGLSRRICTSRRWSVRRCARPVGAVHMTAGHNALRGSTTPATGAGASTGPTPGILSNSLLVLLERCHALIIRSNSRICPLSMRS